MRGNRKPYRSELVDQRAVLARFGDFARQSGDLQEILQEACRLVGGALGTDLAKVLELQADGKTLLVRAGVGWNDGVVGRLTLALDEASSEGHAVLTGEPVVSRDIRKEHRFEVPAFLHEHGVRSLVNVPIPRTGDGPPFGILQVDSRRPRDFAETDIHFLRGYASLLAASVDRLRLLPALRKAVDERDRLLRELQHRTKNTLQIISSFVQIQALRATMPETRRELQAIGSRIDALRLVHEKIYATEEFDRVDLGSYLGELVESLLRFQSSGAGRVRLRMELDSLPISPDMAVPLGLIVNEFVTNSLKYAFDGGQGTIGIELGTAHDRRARLRLWDDGKGLPRDVAGGTGMQLIEGLAQQVGATACWDGTDGTRLTIDFETHS